VKTKIGNVIQFPVPGVSRGKRTGKGQKSCSAPAKSPLNELKQILEEAPSEQEPKSSTINIDHSTGIQLGDNSTAHYHFHHEKPPSLKVLPPPDSIGGQGMLKKAIQDRFNALGDRRKKRFGQSAYGVMYSKFKSDFKIQKNVPWTDIWSWPVETAPAIIRYLDEKLANTIEGRISGAVNKSGYIHTRPHLYKLEKELLEHFDLKLDSPEVREKLQIFFGTTSHTKLSHLQHWQWVCYLEGQVRSLELSD